MSKANNSTSLGLNHSSDYKQWLKDLKQKVQQTQIKAVVQVNTTLLAFYWELGADIVKRQSTANWGDGFLKQLSKDLMKAFPDIKGFSERNLKYIRQWFLFYSQGQAIGQQPVAQLAQVPWGHNLQIIPAHTADITEHTAIISAYTGVIPAHSAVIPAKAGIHRVFNNA
ncbi:DUF1016 N-terminal domain-containing protein [Endozoicomonas atrinae]|uniref:DUF1016 N-terminal domain-containing protein n=1 Tax=Endozoicomonas atrinae TaxID=1333660 RepID=UPI000A3E0A79|nr:DUF1016 N-terminal domain-containing protein [Endozoicomonas atrinae]